MTLVELEGKWINVDEICVIRPNPGEPNGFETEIVLTNGTVGLKMNPAAVLVAICEAVNGHE